MPQVLSPLPDWPSVSAPEADGSCCVEGSHDTYQRLQIAEVLRALLVICCCLGWIQWLARDDVPALPLIIGSVFLMLEKSPLLICKWLFPVTTRVWFENDYITVNGQCYQTIPGVTVQFRSSEKYLHEGQEHWLRRRRESNRLSTLDVHKLRYRKVEMIYGGNVVPIAVVSDEARAAQFVIALQVAYAQSQISPRPTQAQTNTTSTPLA